ncbi:MAG: carbohydrate-binding domain-containing protein [Anaerolineales bacterium]|nr:carbohydrate-binding domain-containing protein [Anaerolineales bacterium]
MGSFLRRRRPDARLNRVRREKSHSQATASAWKAAARQPTARQSPSPRREYTPFSGTLNNGQILVESAAEGTVNLILNGADISNTSTSPIFISSADKTIITLADGTQNTLTDGASYTFTGADVDEPNATLFSKDDLVINGNGSLTVNANYNNGIASKDYLRIVSGNITVNAVNDGIKGRNYITVKDATITVRAGGDGLQSNNDEDAEKGYILIEGGVFNITAGMDGIQAETRLTINAGTFNISTAGGSAVNYEFEESAKGLKAGADVTIAGGAFNIDSADDAIHSNGSLTINGGELQISSGDDGIHADAAITVNNGTLNILKAYEGIESVITINGGNIHLNASDDGINGSGGADGSSVNGRPGRTVLGSGNAQVFINGSYRYVNAQGDGLDSNGTMAMSGGTVIVNGPTNNGTVRWILAHLTSQADS